MTAQTQLPRLTAGLNAHGRLSLHEHLGLHGPLPSVDAGLVAEVARSGLKGRGGADFPTATKLEAVAGANGPAVVVANGSEGEPMSSKDRTLLERAPHLVLDGAIAAAAIVRARRVLVSVQEGCLGAISSMRTAITERSDAAHVSVVPVSGRYLAGEESALVNLLSGGPLKPTLVPPRPFQRGVDRRPTLVQNVETLAHLALIARHGGDWFRAIGTDDTPGSALVTLNGATSGPGVYEVAIGTRLDDVLGVAGGVTERHQGVLVGGYFGTWVPASATANLTLDDTALTAFGASFGSGVIVVLPESACPAAEVARVVTWLAGETALRRWPTASLGSSRAARMTTWSGSYAAGVSRSTAGERAITPTARSASCAAR